MWQNNGEVTFVECGEFRLEAYRRNQYFDWDVIYIRSDGAKIFMAQGKCTNRTLDAAQEEAELKLGQILGRANSQLNRLFNARIAKMKRGRGRQEQYANQR